MGTAGSGKASAACRDWQKDSLVSLSGVYLSKEKPEASTIPPALKQILADNPNIKNIALHLDNDLAGRSATRAIQAVLFDKYEVVDEPPIVGKDYNEMLNGITKQKIEKAITLEHIR